MAPAPAPAKAAPAKAAAPKAAAPKPAPVVEPVPEEDNTTEVIPGNLEADIASILNDLNSIPTE